MQIGIRVDVYIHHVPALHEIDALTRDLRSRNDILQSAVEAVSRRWFQTAPVQRQSEEESK